MPPVNGAYVTLVTNDGYVDGALVLAASLRDTECTYPLVILHTADVSESALARLRDAASDLVQCEPIIVNDPRLALLARPELNISFTKLWAWTLTHYAKIVFLDADVLVVANIDDLMARTAEFVAAPDSGWPDIFNSGVFVATPARATFDALCSRLAEFGSFDGGDQGLLNAHFGDAWRGDLAYRLPFTDNTTPSGAYQYVPAYREFASRVRILHFIGADAKPWRYPVREADGEPELPASLAPEIKAMVRKWWALRKTIVSTSTTSSSSWSRSVVSTTRTITTWVPYWLKPMPTTKSGAADEPIPYSFDLADSPSSSSSRPGPPRKLHGTRTSAHAHSWSQWDRHSTSHHHPQHHTQPQHHHDHDHHHHHDHDHHHHHDHDHHHQPPHRHSHGPQYTPPSAPPVPKLPDHSKPLRSAIRKSSSPSRFAQSPIESPHQQQQHDAELAPGWRPPAHLLNGLPGDDRQQASDGFQQQQRPLAGWGTPAHLRHSAARRDGSPDHSTTFRDDGDDQYNGGGASSRHDPAHPHHRRSQHHQQEQQHRRNSVPSSTDGRCRVRRNMLDIDDLEYDPRPVQDGDRMVDPADGAEYEYTYEPADAHLPARDRRIIRKIVVTRTTTTQQQHDLAHTTTTTATTTASPMDQSGAGRGRSRSRHRLHQQQRPASMLILTHPAAPPVPMHPHLQHRRSSTLPLLSPSHPPSSSMFSSSDDAPTTPWGGNNDTTANGYGWNDAEFDPTFAAAVADADPLLSKQVRRPSVPGTPRTTSFSWPLPEEGDEDHEYDESAPPSTTTPASAAASLFFDRTQAPTGHSDEDEDDTRPILRLKRTFSSHSGFHHQQQLQQQLAESDSYMPTSPTGTADRPLTRTSSTPSIAGGVGGPPGFRRTSSLVSAAFPFPPPLVDKRTVSSVSLMSLGGANAMYGHTAAFSGAGNSSSARNSGGGNFADLDDPEIDSLVLGWMLKTHGGGVGARPPDHAVLSPSSTPAMRPGSAVGWPEGGGDYISEDGDEYGDEYGGVGGEDEDIDHEYIPPLRLKSTTSLVGMTVNPRWSYVSSSASDAALNAQHQQQQYYQQQAMVAAVLPASAGRTSPVPVDHDDDSLAAHVAPVEDASDDDNSENAPLGLLPLARPASPVSGSGSPNPSRDAGRWLTLDRPPQSAPAVPADEDEDEEDDDDEDDDGIVIGVRPSGAAHKSAATVIAASPRAASPPLAIVAASPSTVVPISPQPKADDEAATKVTTTTTTQIAIQVARRSTDGQTGTAVAPSTAAAAAPAAPIQPQAPPTSIRRRPGSDKVLKVDSGATIDVADETDEPTPLPFIPTPTSPTMSLSTSGVLRSPSLNRPKSLLSIQLDALQQNSPTVTTTSLSSSAPVITTSPSVSIAAAAAATSLEATTETTTTTTTATTHGPRSPFLGGSGIVSTLGRLDAPDAATMVVGRSVSVTTVPKSPNPRASVLIASTTAPFTSDLVATAASAPEHHQTTTEFGAPAWSAMTMSRGGSPAKLSTTPPSAIPDAAAVPTRIMLGSDAPPNATAALARASTYVTVGPTILHSRQGTGHSDAPSAAGSEVYMRGSEADYIVKFPEMPRDSTDDEADVDEDVVVADVVVAAPVPSTKTLSMTIPHHSSAEANSVPLVSPPGGSAGKSALRRDSTESIKVLMRASSSAAGLVGGSSPAQLPSADSGTAAATIAAGAGAGAGPPALVRRPSLATHTTQTVTATTVTVVSKSEAAAASPQLHPHPFRRPIKSDSATAGNSAETIAANRQSMVSLSSLDESLAMGAGSAQPRRARVSKSGKKKSSIFSKVSHWFRKD